MRFFHLLALASGLSMLLLGACSDPFPPDTLVQRLRILGVRAQPPDVGIDEQCSMDALVVDPYGHGRALSYTWAVCMVQIKDVASDLQCPGPDSYVFGHDASAELSVAELAAWARENGLPIDSMLTGMSDSSDISEIPIIVGVKITAVGGDEVTAIKRIYLRLTTDAQKNSNPGILDLQKQGTPGIVQLGQKAKLVPVVSDGSREKYVPLGQQQEDSEDLVFSWYSTTGEFRDRWTVLDVSEDGQPLEENEWILPDDQEQLGKQKLWLLVRDGRWGIDWAEYDFTLEP